MLRAGSYRWITLFLAITITATACGSESTSPAASTTTGVSVDDLFGDTTTTLDETPTASGVDEVTTTTAEPDPCAGVITEATEIGVDADTITLLVAADIDPPPAPGLFKDAAIGVMAWADHVNANGGLACRQVKVIEFDTLLNPSESVNAQIKACEDALAMVGTTALFVFETTVMNTCPDQAGDPTGVPDIAQLTTEVAHQCSENTFPVISRQGSCPFDGGPRVFAEQVGDIRWFQDNISPDLRGVFIAAGDLASIRQAAVTSIRAMESAGVENVGEFAPSGLALQPVYTPYVQALADNDANLAVTRSNDQSLIKWRREAAAQGVEIEIWSCTIACYTQSFFEAGGDVIDGTYVTILSIPFAESDTNAELQAYVDSVSSPAAFGLNAWAAGVMLQDAVEAIVASDGVNAITRQSLLDQLSTVTSFDAHGMIGATNPAEGRSGSCFMILQVQDKEFVRIYPTERGALDCNEDNIVELTLDAAKEAEKLG